MRLAQKYAYFSLPILVLGFITAVGPQVIAVATGEAQPDLTTGAFESFGGLIIFAISSALLMGLARIALAAARGQAPHWGLFVISGSVYLQVAVVGLVVWILTGLGLLCFLIPGIVVALRWSQFYMLLLDGKASWYESMTISRTITNGHKGKIAEIFTILMLLSLPTYAMSLYSMNLSGIDFTAILNGTTPEPIQTPLSSALDLISSMLSTVLEIYGAFVAGVTYERLMTIYKG